MMKHNLKCEFELRDDNLNNLIRKLDVLFRLCDRNPFYHVEHNLIINDTNTLFIKIYKDDRNRSIESYRKN